MKRKVYWIRIEALIEIYKCITQNEASAICQEYYQLIDSLPQYVSLSSRKPIIYWIEDKECKMTDHLNEITDFEYKQLTVSDIIPKPIKGYYIKVEDVLELNKTISFSKIDDYLTYYGLMMGSVKRRADKNHYFYWVKGVGLLATINYKPKGSVQLTVEDILKLHSHENRLQKQETDVVRGDDAEGNRVQSRKRKAITSVGHLSYKAIKS